MGLLRLQAGARAFDSGRIETEKIKELPVYFDDTPGMTIAHIIDRLFFLSETKDIRMAVIDGLQDINTSQLNVSSRERELNSVLRLLKTVAEALDIVIIVKSSVSEYNSRHWEPPTVRDILDVTEAETICDQIILLHRMSVTSDYYKAPFFDIESPIVVNCFRIPIFDITSNSDARIKALQRTVVNCFRIPIFDITSNSDARIKALQRTVVNCFRIPIFDITSNSIFRNWEAIAPVVNCFRIPIFDITSNSNN